ncbi:MAG: restriction endonuclease subunit S [Bdellovibrionota bacterium]
MSNLRRFEDFTSERKETSPHPDHEKLLSVTGGLGVLPQEETGRKDTSSEDKSKYKLVFPGDVVYNTMRLWQGVVGYSRHKGIVSPAYTVLKVNADIVDPIYLYYAMKSPEMISTFHAYSKGLCDDTNNCKYSTLANIPINVPKAKVQLSIIETLRALDDQILNHQELISKNETFLLGLRDELTLNPQKKRDWKSVPLGLLFSNSKTKGIRDVPMGSVTMHDGLVLRNEVDRKVESELKDEDHLYVEKGNLAYNMMRMWQGVVGFADRDYLVSPAYVVLKPKKNVCGQFFYYQFRTQKLIRFFHRFSIGVTDDRLRLYFDDFEKIKTECPSFEYQTEVCKIIEDEQSKVQKMKEKLVALSFIKNGVASDLLNGRVKIGNSI